MKDVERFIIELRPVPPGRYCFDRDPWYRMRGLLKVALRRFGLWCTRVEVKSGAPACPATEKPLLSRASTPIRSGDGCSPHYTRGSTDARDELTA